jgi:hypothetical protein
MLVTAKAGDILYLPMQCFHQVQSIGRTIAVSLWFDFHGVRGRFGSSQGGGFSAAEVLDVLLGSDGGIDGPSLAPPGPVGSGGSDLPEFKANTGKGAPALAAAASDDGSESATTTLAQLGGCLWLEELVCSNFEDAALALDGLQP